MSQTRKLTGDLGIENPLGIDLSFTGCQLAAKSIRPGELFIATQGSKHHGIEFLDEAIANGASAVLTDANHLPNFEFPYLIHPEPRSIAGMIADQLLGTRDSAMRLFGVTGTNGKTSTATYIHQLLIALGTPAGLSASTGRVVGDQILDSGLTTPEAPELHRLLLLMREAGQNTAVLEVSAQALIRHRVDGISFATVGFTNLSRDHLDDFSSMDHYLEAKARLFSDTYAKQAVVMVDDEHGQRLAELCRIPTLTLGEQFGQWRYRYQAGNLQITNPEGDSLSSSFGAGGLMAKNFALATVMLAVSGFSLDELSKAMPLAQAQVPGRLQRVSEALPAVFVDYAHTPKGVEGAVTELLSRFSKLVVVLGASGNRDQGKRKDMALATKGATLLVVTDQHPRDEDPAEIRKTLMSSATEAGIPAVEVQDPAAAIAHAISAAELDGAVLWCGPGNLDYREIRGEHVPFNAIEIARKLVEND